MIKFLLRLVINIAVTVVAFWVAVQLLPEMTFSGTLVNWVVVAVVFGLINALIRPIVTLLTLPINVVTLGLFTLVINALMLWLTALLFPALSLQGMLFGFVTAFLGAIIISIVSTILNWIIPG